MKLNTKRTILVGMAFLSISAFWQLYDNVVPLILKNTFNMPDGISGVIMALDNVLALFLLPLFGKLSDNVRTPLGKRRPFILFGTACAVVLMNLLVITEKLVKVLDRVPMLDAAGQVVLNGEGETVYQLVLEGGLSACIPFVIVLGLLLIAMGTYRSPAVALMPDVTPKPLRSKSNAIINLMGALGGVFTLVVTGFLVGVQADGRPDYQPLFIAVSALMVIAVLILLFFVKENKLAAEAAAINASLEAEHEPEPAKAAETSEKLSPELRRSLILILLSVFFWFMGYNAVSTSFTKYVAQRWNYDLSAASQFLLVGTVSAVISYLPVGMLSSKFGRKRIIQIGVVILALAFAVAATFASFNPGIYVVFAAVGIAWAMINVNSYPMVVEISKSGDVGKYTGYYYTFSMAAQIITPILSGFLLQYVGYHTLLPYAAIMVAISFITISLTKHGDNKPEPPKSKLEAFDVGDD